MANPKTIPSAYDDHEVWLKQIEIMRKAAMGITAPSPFHPMPIGPGAAVRVSTNRLPIDKVMELHRQMKKLNAEGDAEGYVEALKELVAYLDSLEDEWDSVSWREAHV